MNREQRKALILDRLSSKGNVSVTSLSKLLKTSDVTIRKDLQILEEEGLLKRTHGGAMNVGNVSSWIEMNEEISPNQHAKQKIAQRAYDYIHDNDTIYLDTSTTVYELVKILARGSKQNLNIVTASIKIAHMLLSPAHNVIQLGGQLRLESMSATGYLAVDTIRKIHIEKAFLGVNGIDINNGYTTDNLFECDIKSEIVRSSTSVFILSDSSKMNLTSFGIICPIERPDYLITDRKCSSVDEEAIRQAGGRIVFADY